MTKQLDLIFRTMYHINMFVAMLVVIFLFHTANHVEYVADTRAEDCYVAMEALREVWYSKLKDQN